MLSAAHKILIKILRNVKENIRRKNIEDDVLKSPKLWWWISLTDLGKHNF